MADVPCTRCGKKVSTAEVKYVNASDYVCPACFTAETGSTKIDESPSQRYDASPVKRKQLECQKCGFINKVREDADHRPSCSYCGGSDLVEKTSTAAQLLAESETTDE